MSAIRCWHDYVNELSHNLVRCLIKQGKFEEAIEFGQEALDFCRNGDDKVRPALQAELPSLEKLLRRAKANGQPEVAEWQQQLAKLLDAFRKKNEEAVQP